MRLPNPYGNDFSGVSGPAAELFFSLPVLLVPDWARGRPGTACAPGVCLVDEHQVCKHMCAIGILFGKMKAEQLVSWCNG